MGARAAREAMEKTTPGRGAFIIATLVVAALGATVGWMTGSITLGTLIGALIGTLGAARSGYVMSEPNLRRPPWT